MLTSIETPMPAAVTEPDDYPAVDELRRLAERAQERGVVIEREGTTARAYDPDRRRWFALTAFSCECRRFAVAGGCQHFAVFAAGEGGDA